MKRILLSLLVIASTVTAFSQSKQYVLFEHFTQASCGPCAVQNPSFEAVVAENEGKYHHIAYHTSWPGFDPMHDLNPTDVQARVDYYNVTGVPDMNMLGSTWNGGPAGVTTAQIQAAGSQTAPIRLKVIDEVTTGTTHEITVELIETGDLVGTDLRLRVAVLEEEIAYDTPPGSNGESVFPNVFRLMPSGTDGEQVTAAGQGNTQTFTFTYEESAEYNMDAIYVVAFLQDDDTGVVINSGSSHDPLWQAVNASPSTFAGGAGPHTFGGQYSSDATDETLEITLTSDAPDSWASVITIDGVEQSGTTVEVMTTGAVIDFGVVVTPDAQAGIGDYTITITNSTYPDDPAEALTYSVISGITDLIVVNSYSDGGGGTFNWDEDYTNGLDAAGNTGYGILDVNKFISGMASSSMDEVNNIYFNVSWTFPSFTDEKVAALSAFLDEGKNMFVSGQDIGWDTYEGNGTPATQAFYTDYLNANYDGDGGPGNSQLTWSGDNVFDLTDGSSIVNAYSGGAYLYPDELTPIDPAVPVFHYNSDESKVGCVRSEEDGHKVVYMGIDTRMISDEAVRSAVISISHDWFYGVISSLEYDIAIREALGQSYPNPAVDRILIPLETLTTAADITVVDISGRIVHQGRVAEGQQQYGLSVGEWADGNYTYFLTTSEGRSEAKHLQVAK